METVQDVSRVRMTERVGARIRMELSFMVGVIAFKVAESMLSWREAVDASFTLCETLSLEIHSLTPSPRHP